MALCHFFLEYTTMQAILSEQISWDVQVKNATADQFFPNPFDTNNTAPLSGRERLCPIHMYNLPIVLPVLPRIRSTHFCIL